MPSATLTPEHPLVNELGECSLELMWVLRQDAARSFEPLGLRSLRAILLEFIARGYNQPKMLAERLCAAPPAISTLIAELEARGFIERQADPHDGRRVNLVLTEAGDAVRDELRGAWNQTGFERLSTFSNDELKAFIRLCRKLLGSA